MDKRLALPFAMIGEGDVDAEHGSFDENQFGSVEPEFNLPPVINYAENAECVAQFRKEIYSTMEWTWINRINLEEEWRAIRRQRMQQHDTGRKYYGRSDAYIPLYARTETTLVSTLSRGLFPSDEYMDAVEQDTGDPEAAKPAKAYMQYELDKVARIRVWMKRFLQQFVAWGNSPIKVWYGTEFRAQARKQLSDYYGTKVAEPHFQLKTLREGARVSVRSLLYWYCYPTIADSLEDCTLVFEDIDVPVGYIKEMCRRGIWKNEQDALRSPIPPNHLINQQDVLTNSYGITPPATGILGDRLVGGTRVLTEGYSFMKLPSSAYTADEDKNDLLPVHFVCAGTKLMWLSRNENWHQRHPYLIARQNVEPGFFYGHGEGRRMRPLSYLVNDFANQGNDVLQYGINAVNKVNPAHVAGPLPPMRPGVVWKMTDVKEGHIFDRPPTEGAQHAMDALGMYLGMGQDFSGTPPVIQGSGGGKNARTATGAAILQRNALSPIQDKVEDIELEVLNQMMELIWINAQQFRDSDVMTMIAGEKITITPDQLAGNYDFTWMASTQTANQSQRTQQLMSFLQAIGPMIQLLNQQGKIFDPVPLLRRVWADGFGMRGFDQLIHAAQPVLQQGVQPPNGGAPATSQGVQQEQSDRLRSAIEQAWGQDGTPVDMQPGEGEDFADIRKESDQIAAQMGRGGPHG